MAVDKDIEKLGVDVAPTDPDRRHHAGRVLGDDGRIVLDACKRMGVRRGGRAVPTRD